MPELRNRINQVIREDICPGWGPFFQEETGKDYFRMLDACVTASLGNGTVFPPMGDLFRAFEIRPERIKIVILGQDPYHTPGMANGLAFSVNEGCKVPPSLRNIEKELTEDRGQKLQSTDLTYLRDQGVFLLNTCLSVRSGEPQSHSGIGWEEFTQNALLHLLREQTKPIVFILWGGKAQKYENLIQGNAKSREVLVLKAAHPSPLSAYKGFFGSKLFSKANEFLKERGEQPIEWGKESEE